MRVVLPGDPLYVDPYHVSGVSIRLEQANTQDSVVYKPFEMVFKDVVVVSDGAPMGEADQTITIQELKASGTAMGEVMTDPDGNKFVVELRPTEVATHAPPGFEGC